MKLDDERLVADFYEPLYRFALSLAKSEADAADLVQQTFLRWAQKGHQLRDPSKIKSWLFTTLHREFLSSHRRRTRFPQVNIESARAEMPNIASQVVELLDSKAAVQALETIELRFRSPLSLFYFKGKSYREISSLLNIPIGTVMSRISRGKSRLRETLLGLE